MNNSNDTEQNKSSRQKLFEEYVRELNATWLVNDQAYDKAILTLSSAGLGFSLSIVNILFPGGFQYHCFLYATWILFSLAIITTITSFILSRFGRETTVEYAQKYIIEEDKTFLNKQTAIEKISEWLTIISGAIFILAIIFISLFCILNMSQKGGTPMAANDIPASKAQKVLEMIKGQPKDLKEAAQRPLMPTVHQANSEKTAQNPQMPKIGGGSQNKPPAPSNNDNSSNSSSSDSKK